MLKYEFSQGQLMFKCDWDIIKTEWVPTKHINILKLGKTTPQLLHILNDYLLQWRW